MGAAQQQMHGYAKTVYNVDDVTSAANHDAEQVNTSVILSSIDLELNKDGSNNDSIVGLLFDGFTIPSTALITNAYIEFMPDTTRSATTSSVTIKGQKGAEPAAFTTGTNNISNRNSTTNTVSWTNIGTWTINTINANSTTPDISSIIQEIINDGSYASGHNIVIIFDPVGTSRRSAHDYSTESEAPHLFITYLD